MIIHAEHQFFGINPADASKEKENRKSVYFAQKIADRTSAEKIIIHPGHIENRNCSLENAISFFNKINDKRILMENLPPMKNVKRLCMNLEDVKEFIEKTGAGLCFDVNHAIQARGFDKNYDFIRDYLNLSPSHYHIGGQKPEKDHLCFSDSEIDLRKILEYYPESAEITLETEPVAEKFEKDLEIIRDSIRRLGK